MTIEEMKRRLDEINAQVRMRGYYTPQESKETNFLCLRILVAEHGGQPQSASLPATRQDVV